jgi:hypothetical protein
LEPNAISHRLSSAEAELLCRCPLVSLDAKFIQPLLKGLVKRCADGTVGDSTAAIALHRLRSAVDTSTSGNLKQVGMGNPESSKYRHVPGATDVADNLLTKPLAAQEANRLCLDVDGDNFS